MSDTQKLNDLLHLAHTRVLNAEELESLNALNGGLAELLGLQFTHVARARSVRNCRCCRSITNLGE